MMLTNSTSGPNAKKRFPSSNAKDDPYKWKWYYVFKRYQYNKLIKKSIIYLFWNINNLVYILITYNNIQLNGR